MNELPTSYGLIEPWYTQLVEDCKDIITEAVFTSRWALVEGYHQLGERIVTEQNLDRKEIYGKKILQDLGKSLGISKSTLYYSIQFYEQYPNLDIVPEGKNITWNKLVNKYLSRPKVESSPQLTGTDVSLIQGDMTTEVPRLGQFDLIIADPPYNVSNWEWDKIPEYKSQIKQWLEIIKRAFADKYHFFWFCSPKWATDTELVFRELSIPIKSRIVWHRRNMALGSDATDCFIDTWELILHSGNTSLNYPEKWDDSRFDVQTFAVPQTNFEDTKLHPTQKPLELIQWLVCYGSLAGQNVLDPFAGAGTTAVACGDTRHCTLIEKEAEYIEIIKRRLGI